MLFRQYFAFLCSALLLMVSSSSAFSKNETDLNQKKQIIHSLFSDNITIKDKTGELPIWDIYKGNQLIGYAFESVDIVDIPAYSGKPVNMLIGLDLDGKFKGAKVLEHHEPILLVGIPESALTDFSDQYTGKFFFDKIRVGSAHKEGYSTIDAVTGATVTVMVVNQTIMRAAQKVALEKGIAGFDKNRTQPAATVKYDVDNALNWRELLNEGSVRNMRLTAEQVDRSFIGTEAEGINLMTGEEGQESFIDLYFAHLNPPSVGKSLLGDTQYAWIMSELKEGDHVIAVMANGIYSFRGNGFVRGGIFDRVQLLQHNQTITFRDLDYFRTGDVYAEGIPDFKEMAIFIIRNQYDFDPSRMWQLELLVRRQVGALQSVFVSFYENYELPRQYLNIPEPMITADDLNNDEPIWIAVWKNRAVEAIVLVLALMFLTVVIFLQDWLVLYPRFLHNLRRGFLYFTLFFIGWYSLGQLSIVNVFTFLKAFMTDFKWDMFLLDPVIFLLWSFVAFSMLLWGRGIYCGWLCPFGALQELLSELAIKLHIKQIIIPFRVHERLWAIKYMLFLGLFAVSFESLSLAEQLAEIEPFKTSITLRFLRSWPFVLYALLLLGVGLFIRKFYCRYLCPLGAALAIPSGSLRLFNWLKRRNECGKPCQLCAVECEIQAIDPEGEINLNECHHCLDCQVTYHDQNKCPPLVNKNRKRKKKTPGTETHNRISTVPKE